MQLNRRNFLHRGSLTTLALAAGSGLSTGASFASDTPELANLRQIVAGYASQVTVRSDSCQQLELVCEIADLGKFSKAMSDLIPADGLAQADGNTLSFEQNGRHVRIENVWKS